MTADEVERQIKNALDWLHGDRIEYRRFAAVLILKGNECAFPVCRPCYEYEQKEGNKCWPQCNIRYKRHLGELTQGSPLVEGDDEEDDVDDLENEFNHSKATNKASNPWSSRGREEVELSSSSRHESYHRILRLTSGQQVKLYK